MTEKRFTLIEESDWWGVTDNQLPKTEYGFREDLPNGYLSCDYRYNDLTPQEVVDLLNELHEENQQLIQLLKNQSAIIQELHSKLLEYQLKEPIILTREDLETMGGAISYYTHGRCGE